ncbi:hypothetical protein EV715DRAFT_247538 [Schizophyllum commune]
MCTSDVLPSELWLEVFDWALTPGAECNPYTDSYVPFHAEMDDFERLAMKRTLNLVCRLWHALTTELLYRDVVISPKSTHALHDLLERECKEHPSYGKWVRRVVLPYTSTVTKSPKPLESVDILKSCPNLEVLVRPPVNTPEPLEFEFEADDVAWPSLRRLDWYGHGEAERTGGVNSLHSVLHNAPSLRYLLVGSVGQSGAAPSGVAPGNLCLPHLETLRLDGVNGTLLHQICSRWALPALTHVVLDSPALGLDIDAVWDAFGDQLEIVECGRHMRFLFGDVLTPCLGRCPNLEELNYHVFYTSAPASVESICHKGLKTVGLHAAVNKVFSKPAEIWAHLQSHVDFIASDALPGLKTINLYGQWRGIMRQPAFEAMWKQLIGRRCSIVYNGQVLVA